MDMKQKKLISNFLLAVGVIFILVAGSVFVATAWKYIPVFVKQLALLGISLGMFAGSVATSKNEKLGIVEHALFYLGTAFVGFFVIAIMGGLLNSNLVENAFRVMIANGAMMIPIVVKLIAKKSNVELVTLTLLLDNILMSGCIAFETTFSVYLLLFAGVVVVLSILDAVQQENNSDRNVCLGILYLIHFVCYTAFAMLYMMMEGMNVISSVFVAVLVVVTGISWKSREEKWIRICNSLTILWLLVSMVFASCNVMDYNGDYGIVCLSITLLASLLMLILRREEIVGTLAVAAAVIPYIQLFCYLIDYLGSCMIDFFERSGEMEWSCTYYAHSFVFMLAFFAFYVMKYGMEEMKENWKESRILKLTGLQAVNGVSLFLASKMETSFCMVFFILAAVDLLVAMVLVKNEAAKRVLGTMAMFSGMLAVLFQPFLIIPNNLIVEWSCLLVAISIVLFRFIWYDSREQLSILYFIVTCVLLGILLIRNLASGGLINVLLLGLTGIVILITAASHNNKKYVIASSVTLILLVLYLTKDFWMSIAWWVYLFVAGVVLVLLAIKKAKEL